jgi:Protein of unknown function (DUF2380)
MLPVQLIETQSAGREGRRCMVIWSVATVLLSMTAGRAADRPTLLVLPIEMVDTSGEAPTKAHEHRLATLTMYLSQQLSSRGLYAIIDPAPIAAEIDKARVVQPIDRCKGMRARPGPIGSRGSSIDRRGR